MNGPVRRVLAAAAIAALAATSVPGAADAHGRHDLGRQTLAANDGWAAYDGGTTGGADAARDHVYTVDTWAELKEAVQGDEPKIVKVKGDIDAWTDADGSALTCEAWNDPGYTWESYLETYDPEVWGWNAPAGPVEEARDRSYDAYREHVLLNIGANTTIVGDGAASVTHGSFYISNVDNVIVRNLGIHNSYDCFPAWEGDAWDGEFDNFELSGATHVWLDHLTVDDGGYDDYAEPEIWGAHVEHLDGGIDIVRASDLITVSWSHIGAHDKTMLIGNTDSDRYGEADKLRVTIHHNWFDTTGQRSPRLRWGQAHVYNNYFTRDPDTDYPYYYSIGSGKYSAIYAENNAWDMEGVEPSQALYNWGGDAMHIEGSLFNGEWVDLLAAWNEAHPEAPMTSEITEFPELHGKIHTTWAVPGLVQAWAGAEKLR
ncbi:pectate lyase family protein [Glycomyces rhizosphaerae]|uniref:Polysaccharide lyase family 1 protein n=1 Tax=Glycomyces rhizosphaerae TaxID=2054422 RepID=A0ABV7Q702_9ACTN